MSVLGCVQAARAADKLAPVWLRLPLDKMGFPGLSASLVGQGASMLTVNFIDDDHLLLTFATRGLVPRVPGDPPEHQDRMVAAEVIELPSGKVQARADWHLHDMGRYLVNMGQGRFLVRIGDELSTMDVAGNLHAHDPLLRMSMPPHSFRPDSLTMAPDGRLLTMETKVNLGAQMMAPKSLVEFYRVSGGGAGGPVAIVDAGKLLSPQPLYLALDGDGTLWADEGSRNEWTVSFHEFGGRVVKIGTLDSLCDPQFQMLSRSEYVAVTCSGADNHTKMVAYAMDGKEMWEEPLAGMDEATYAFAPAAGRFAVIRTIEGVSAPGNLVDTPPVDRQELRVYQTESGDMLMKAVGSPAIKTGENFDMAADGSLAVVVRDGALCLYKLAAPSKQDLKDMEEVAKMSPPTSQAAVSVPEIAKEIGAAVVTFRAGNQVEVAGAGAVEVGRAKVAEANPGGGSAVASVAAGAPMEAGSAQPAVRRVEILNGDPVYEGPREVPTIMKPGEKPEFGKRNPVSDTPQATDEGAPPQ